jgi:hypothetical protein
MRSDRVLGVLLAAAISAPALADITGPAFRIDASNELGQGFFEVPESWGQWNNGVWTWQAQIPYVVQNTAGLPIATLTNCAITYVEDPVVSLTFGVQAGSSATTFQISSALLNFPTISPATGNASAGVSITDLNGDGAQLTGLEPGGLAYRSQYNGLVPLGTDFASFITGPMTAGSFATVTDSGNVGPTAIGAAVSSMSARWNFTLTANDTAAGTSVFNIVPAPGAGAVLAMGLLAFRRRR